MQNKQALLVGLGTAGAMTMAAIPAVKTTGLFARQFGGEVTQVKSPKMVYDPASQMMVDPTTHQALYQDAQKLADCNPTVTAGCDDCPKCDDCCQ